MCHPNDARWIPTGHLSNQLVTRPRATWVNFPGQRLSSSLGMGICGGAGWWCVDVFPRQHLSAFASADLQKKKNHIYFDVPITFLRR